MTPAENEHVRPDILSAAVLALVLAPLDFRPAYKRSVAEEPDLHFSQLGRFRFCGVGVKVDLFQGLGLG